MFVFLQLLSVSYRIENNHIVSLCIDTYRIVGWPYRLIPNADKHLIIRLYAFIIFSFGVTLYTNLTYSHQVNNSPPSQ